MDLPIATNNPSTPNNTPQSLPALPPLGEPSKSRREALKLHNETAPISLSNLTPITKYYSAADKVLVQFKLHLAKGELDDAYIIGRRFVLFSTVSLPGHHYYGSPTYLRQRIKNQKDAAWVTRGLERIVEVMDEEENKKQCEEKKIIQIQKKIEDGKRLQWEKKMKERLTGVDSSGFVDLQSSNNAMDMDLKLENLNTLFPKNDQSLQYDDMQTLCLEFDQDVHIIDEEIKKQDEPSAMITNEDLANPPPYTDLFLDTLKTTMPRHLPTPIATSPRLSIRELRYKSTNEFNYILSNERMEIIKLSTYQGRLSHTPAYDSTNGCTVIAPLIVATHINPHHYITSNKQFKYGISNSEINEIIDKRSPPILKLVRDKLELNEHALIIPSDAHDYFVDEKILPQNLFVGVCGGNLVNKVHCRVLVDMLMSNRTSNGSRMHKVGAALFFRDHVISLLKIPLDNGSCYFDVIDSLPSSLADGMALRIRCKDQSSFESVLQWYACSKFSEAHCDFIDDHEWNNDMCDFDPRVFQGFVWTE